MKSFMHIICPSSPRYSSLLPPANDYRAAWSGTRIILRQTSPEANDIFDLIIALYIACDGDWQALQKLTGISRDEMSAWLDYAATFLSNIGNYYVGQRLSYDAGQSLLSRALAIRSSHHDFLWRY